MMRSFTQPIRAERPSRGRRRGPWRIAWLLAGLALIAAGGAKAATLFIVPDKNSYQVGETITLDISGFLSGDPSEVTGVGAIQGALLYDPALADPLTVSQRPLTSLGNTLLWNAPSLQGFGTDGLAFAFGQIDPAPGSPPDPDLIDFARVELLAEAPGQLVIGWDTSGSNVSLEFFDISTFVFGPPAPFGSLPEAPAIVVQIGSTGPSSGPDPPFVTRPNVVNSLSGPGIGGFGDVDGDGDVDFFSRGLNNQIVTWYENDGTGFNFTERTVANTLGITTFAFPGDFDGDGDLDELIVEQSPSQLSWVANDGTGTFGAQQTISTSIVQAPIAFPGDVDGDGDLDVLVADTGSFNLFWFENSAGDGSSWTQRTIAALSGGQNILPGDIDGDGDLDAVVRDFDNDTIVWYDNTAGDGSSWTLRTITNSAIGVTSAFPDDVDGDGDVDVVAANFTGNSIVWYDNLNGAGTSWAPRTVGTGFSGANVAIPQDVDGDGDQDIFAAAFAGNEISWFENVDGQALTWVERSIDTTVTNPIAVAASDLDNDGDLDAVAVVQGDDTIRLYENETIHRSAFFRADVVDAARPEASAVVTGDIDGDGDEDVFSLSRTNGTLEAHLNSAGDASTWTKVQVAGAAAERRALSPVDVDGDGDLDTFSSRTGGITWHENTSGDGTTWVPRGVSLVDSNSIDAADIDGDGDPDLLATDNGGTDRLLFYENTAGDGSSWTETAFAVGAVLGAEAIRAVDVDGDGDLDAISASSGDDEIAWYENTDGAGSFGPQQIVSTTLVDPLSIESADVDRDGDVDLLAASLAANEIRWFENVAGDGSSWTSRIIWSGPPTGSRYGSIQPLDLDIDGDIDLLTINETTGGVVYFLNLAAEGSSGFLPFLAAALPQGLAPGDPIVDAADLDDDGDLDIVGADFGGGTVRWLENIGGQYALSATTTAPAIVGPYGEDDVLQVSLFNRGRPGDHTISLASLDLRFEDGAGAPLTSAALDDLLVSVSIYLDDPAVPGFDPGDTLVDTQTTFSLDGSGTQRFFFAGGADLEVAPPFSKRYFVVLDLEPNAGPLAPGQIQVVYPGSSGGTAFDTTFGTLVSPELTSEVGSGVFSVLAPNDDADGDGLTNAVETGTGVFVSASDTGTDPFLADSDDDGIDDGDEIRLGANANVAEQAAPPFVSPAPVSATLDAPTQVELADIDGDGDLDSLVADGVGQRVIWYENTDGKGLSWTLRDVATSVGAVASAVAADIDGDGDLDVLFGRPDLSWAENLDGSGTSWSVQTIRTGSGLDALFVAAADLDGDGDLDAISANGTANSVLWHDNTLGDGSTWVDNVVFPTSAVAIDTVDIDLDGNLDLLIAIPGSGGGVLLLRNLNGDGSSWSPTGITPTFSDVDALASGDFDQDGDPDIAAAWRGSSRVVLYLNQGGGSFTSVDVDTSALQATSLEAVDVDDDGDLDLLAALQGSGFVWYENVFGTATIFTKREFTTPGDLFGAGPLWITAGDVDSDGQVDAMGVARQGGSVEWFRNARIHREVVLGPEVEISNAFLNPTNARPVDFNNDGNQDVLVYSQNNGTLSVFLDGSGSSTTWAQVPIGTSFATPFVFPADLDGDADFDVVAVDQTNGNVYWYDNLNGDGFAWLERQIASGVGGGSIFPVDLDGDGDQDLITPISWIENLGNAASWSSPVFFSSRQVVVSFFGDLDGDGDQDILSSVGFPGIPTELYWYENTIGDGSVLAERLIDASTSSSASFALGFPGDFDGDGDLDISIARNGDGQIDWYENVNGDGSSFVLRNNPITAVGPVVAIPIDIDDDGDLDLYSDEFQRIVVYLNVLGDGSFWSPQVLVASAGGTDFAGVAERIDKDGRADLSLSFTGGSRVAWRPDLGGQFSLQTTPTAPAQIVGGMRDDVLRIDFRHEGRFGDNEAELTALELRFEDGGGTPLPGGPVNAIVAALEIHLDDESGSFEDGVDTLVTRIAPLTVSGSGVLTVPFADGDPLVQVPPGTTQSYYVVLEFQPSPPASIEVVHVTSGSSSAEDAVFDLPLTLSYFPDTASGVVAGAADSDGDGVSDAQEVIDGTSLGNPDTDGDGLCDGSIAVAGVCIAGEVTAGTDPTLGDTDGDGLGDRHELSIGRDPLLAADGVLFRTVLRTGVPAPGVGTLPIAPGASSTFARGLAGEVVATGLLTGPGIDPGTNDRALFAQSSGLLDLVARSNDAAPGTTGVFGSLQTFGGRGGATSFLGGLAEPLDERGFWSDRSGSLQLEILEGDVAPGASPATLSNISNSVFNENGSFAFDGFVSGAGIDGSNDFGIWVDSGSGLRLSLREGAPAPASLPGLSFGQGDCLRMGPNGDLSYRAFLSGPGVTVNVNDGGVFLDDGTTVSVIAREGDPAPGTSGFYSNSFNCAPVNASGALAYPGGVITGVGGAFLGSAIWSNRSGSIDLVARAGVPAPGTSTTYQTVLTPGISDDGRVTFRGDLTSGGGGVWISDDPLTQPTLVAREGDPAPGTGQSYGPFLSNPLRANGVGQLAFSHTLDGSGVTPTDSTAIWVDRGSGLDLLLRASNSFEVEAGTLLTPEWVSLIAFDDQSQVTFRARFASDTQSGVFTATFCDVGPDSDGDGTSDLCDNCPAVVNPDQIDSDLDGRGDLCNDALDGDGDEFRDALDSCPADADATQADGDGDRVGDVCDNCSVDPNFDQSDIDGDFSGDVCDGDIDGDGLLNGVETGTGNFVDANDTGSDPRLADTDGDGVDDGIEVAQGTDPTSGDTDLDGIDDGLDNCPFVANAGQANGDPFGAGDACQCGDVDADGDIDQTDVDLVRGNLVGQSTALPFDPARCNVVGPSDGGVTDCDLADIALLRRIVNGVPGAVPGDLCQAYGP